LSTLEEDYKEIGMMKAIGLKHHQITGIYIIKYLFLTGLACIIGYFLSLFLNKQFLKNILLYFGEFNNEKVQLLIPILAIIVTFIIIILFCFITINKFKKISVISALRMGKKGETFKKNNILSLHKFKTINTNILISFRDIILRFKFYFVLFTVFIICTFITIVPLNLYNTISNEDFISYMGMGKSDILIHLRQSDNIEEEFNNIIKKISKDKEIDEYVSLITCQYEVVDNDGLKNDILIETGDFETFPLKYREGVYPVLENEIALSTLNAENFNKNIGDEIEVFINRNAKKLIITGIYDDVTNGGKTAKANIEPDKSTAGWYSINLKVNSDIRKKIDEYTEKFDNAKVTGVREYLDQTFRSTIDSLKTAAIISIIISILITILITSLFMKLLIERDCRQIIIMKNLGIKEKDIRIQYIFKTLTVLILGIITGTVFSNTLGEKIVGTLLKNMQGSYIEFIINPFNTYILIPAVLIISVIFTTIITSISIKKFSLYNIQPE
jgi:putative ABC transport system permease protein